jgi:dihydroorotate dehydrogenase electron transfer subunit
VYCRRVSLSSKRKISEQYYRIGFECEEIAREARPGQFLMVRLADSSWEHLLSRPFSFCEVEGDRIELLFNTVGKGTRSLGNAAEGSLLEILGPLGKGFRLEGDSEAILVGGGMGIAPLPFLAAELAKLPGGSEVMVLLGARTAVDLCLEETFAGLGVETRIATDDGSRGHLGPVTELLEEELAKGTDDRATVYACGPKPMLEATARIARKHGVACQISVEERMACGCGACMGCVCSTRDREGNEHFQRVCVEGPVFDASELIFDED